MILKYRQPKKEEGMCEAIISQQREMKLGELSELSGVPARTIRLYITQGLLPGPLRAGRNAAYGQDHLTLLERIKAFQQEGMTLSQIRRALAGPLNGHELPRPIPSVNYEIAPDVTVTIHGNTSPWRLRIIQQAIGEMQKSLSIEESKGVQQVEEGYNDDDSDE